MSDHLHRTPVLRMRRRVGGVVVQLERERQPFIVQIIEFLSRGGNLGEEPRDERPVVRVDRLVEEQNDRNQIGGLG